MIALSALCRHQFLILTCLALAFAGCATPGALDPLDAPLPPNLVIEPPDPQLPPHIAAMSGIWTGQMSRYTGHYYGQHALVIQSISKIPREYSECPNRHACLKGYGYRARAFMSWRAPWETKGFWLDVIIEPDGIISVTWIRGAGYSKYLLMSPGLKLMRAEWTYRADDYAFATLTRN